MRARPLRSLLVTAAALIAGAALAACGPSDTSAAGGSSAAPTSAAAPTAATVLQQAEIPGSAEATATAAPVAGRSIATTPTGKMKYGESMGYALPATKDWDTALEVRVNDRGAGTFEISVANRTGSEFDLTQLQVRAVDPSGKTVAELEKKDPILFRTLTSPSVVVAPFRLAVDPTAVEIWVQPSPTQTEITSWSTNG